MKAYSAVISVCFVLLAMLAIRLGVDRSNLRDDLAYSNSERSKLTDQVNANLYKMNDLDEAIRDRHSAAKMSREFLQSANDRAAMWLKQRNHLLKQRALIGTWTRTNDKGDEQPPPLGPDATLDTPDEKFDDLPCWMEWRKDKLGYWEYRILQGQPEE